MKHVVDGKLYNLKDAPANTLEERIQRLNDIESIKAVLYNYCHGCDINDAVLTAATFTDDAVLCLNDKATFKGKKTIEQFFETVLPVTGSHHISNMQIWFETPDSAIMFAYLEARLSYPDYPKVADLHLYGRYEARAVRETDGEWRFSYLRLVVAGNHAGGRGGEQFNRPWPPVVDK
jgi:ketosteroid isomerase-like protein